MAVTHSLEASFDNLDQLYRAYMPFVNHGGLFITTHNALELGDRVAVTCTLPETAESVRFEGQVAWINPLGAQGSRPDGVGIKFGEDDKTLRAKLENLLSRKLASVELTSTM